MLKPTIRPTGEYHGTTEVNVKDLAEQLWPDIIKPAVGYLNKPFDPIVELDNNLYGPINSKYHLDVIRKYIPEDIKNMCYISEDDDYEVYAPISNIEDGSNNDYDYFPYEDKSIEIPPGVQQIFDTINRLSNRYLRARNLINSSKADRYSRYTSFN